MRPDAKGNLGRAFALTLLGPVAVVAASWAEATALPGCQEPLSQSPCKDVPDGGCPLSHGLACDDVTCAVAYACNADGTWTFDHACPNYDASAGARIPEAAPPAFDASEIDAPPGAGGGPSCPELLEEPDCTLATALACPSGCCNCIDLFVCDDGWQTWGSCGPTGITPDPTRDH